MKKKTVIIFCLLILLELHCGEDETEDVETGYTALPQISSIIFGNGWSVAESAMTDTATTFSTSDTVIYYDVRFDSTLMTYYMIKKIWDRKLGTDSTNLFTAVCLIPEGSIRICGEFRRYDFSSMSGATYYISLEYFSLVETSYVDARYKPGVNRCFIVGSE